MFQVLLSRQTTEKNVALWPEPLRLQLEGSFFGQKRHKFQPEMARLQPKMAQLEALPFLLMSVNSHSDNVINIEEPHRRNDLVIIENKKIKKK